jgi:hypothetical protein
MPTDTALFQNFNPLLGQSDAIFLILRHYNTNKYENAFSLTPQTLKFVQSQTNYGD